MMQKLRQKLGQLGQKLRSESDAKSDVKTEAKAEAKAVAKVRQQRCNKLPTGATMRQRDRHYVVCPLGGGRRSPSSKEGPSSKPPLV